MFKKTEQRRFGYFVPKQRRFGSINNIFGKFFGHCNFSLFLTINISQTVQLSVFNKFYFFCRENLLEEPYEIDN